VTLTVTDNNGHTQTRTSTVTVIDSVPAVAVCQNRAVQVAAIRPCSLPPDQVNNGSTDASGLGGLSLSQTNFGCGNIGTNTVTLTVTDNDGNSSTCTATITVVDSVPPLAVCKDLTVQLDATGHATITADQLDNGSTDACGIASLSLSQTNFDCANIGTNTVTLTVTDNNGNLSTCSATVTVADSVAPVALCQGLTVQLDATGHATIAPEQINNGSSDACGIANLSLDKTTFDCSNVGANTVTLTVTDNNGNSATCTATVTVIDSI